MTNMHASAEDIAHHLGARRRGAGWMAKCPAHDDRVASLSIMQGTKGTILNCHAGCRLEDICAEMGIRVSQLFEDYAAGGGDHTDVDLMLRDVINRNTPPKVRLEEYTLSQVMDLAFKLPDPEHAEGKARAHLAAPDIMGLEFTEAMKMWGIVADTAVYAYLEPWFTGLGGTRSWHDVRRAAMESMQDAWRKEMKG